MTTQEVKRKLTAILSADVKAYSRLMAEDEKETIHTLNTYKDVTIGLIQHHHGRVVDAPGDNVLAEFVSVVDAVECSVEIQKELKTRNAKLSENRKMEFRVGINLGDVIEEGERIYGDGVNIAARLESLSEAGGICISGTAFDQVKNKLSVGYQYLGRQTVKNIPDPVRAYKVLMGPEAAGRVIGEEQPKETRWGWKAVVGVAALVLVVGGLVWNFYLRATQIEPASKEKMAFPLPDKPSIAVLPFVNMSGDKEQEYFSDGITEEIITALSKIPDLFVISRQSTFTYKGKPVKIKQVSEELGVRYVLEGSVRKSGDKVRITSQLIDAISGHHLWADRYDRDIKDIFALQDEITLKIVTALQVKLIGQISTVWAKGTKSLEAYLRLMQAREAGERWTKEGNALARKLAEEATVLDPNYAEAYLRLSATYLMDLTYGTTEAPAQSLTRAEEYVQKALSLENSSPEAHAFLGRIYLTKRQYEKAIAEGERALALSPNSDFIQAALAFSLYHAGRVEEAMALYKKAIRLSPIPPAWYINGLGSCYREMGRYEEAITEYKKTLQRAPDSLFGHLWLSATYSLMGREKDARTAAEEVLKIDPKFSLEHLAKASLLKNQSDIDRIFGGLRKAGLK